ncbi:hypothetical protein [Lelliottia nimipressuralis]|uniref:Uncharacterized protein n=1 Tax=Lelliottia nimipressuralis TaxID=69220 RepID=A0ABD4KCZ3_9ENTR|nr:hypothetical protein [Lelliottia nimipressuralis]MBF4178901.1 hypothetical protein [Lelliottia nimipressuralis]
MGEGIALIAAGLVGMTSGGGMGLLGGGGSASSTSTSTTTSWLSEMLEPIVTDFINGTGSQGINYTDSVIADMTPAEKAALDAYGNGDTIAMGKNIAGAGAGLVSDSISEIQDLLHGGAKTQFSNGVKGIYGDLSGFMDNQNAAIESDVYSEMGAAFGQTAQSNMASTSVSGSSAAQNATNSVLASGANEMVNREAKVSQDALRGAVGITGNALSGELGLIDQLMKEGGNIFGTGTKMASKGQSNQFKAGIFEQYYNQEVINNNRKNDMINNNMGWLNMAALASEVLPFADIDTTTTGTSTSTQSGGGLF